MRIRIPTAVIIMCALCVSKAAARTWTDSTGKYTVEADFAAFTDREVVLKKGDGKTLSIPVGRLCEADRAFVLTQVHGAGDKAVIVPTLASNELDRSLRAAVVASAKARYRDGEGTRPHQVRNAMARSFARRLHENFGTEVDPSSLRVHIPGGVKTTIRGALPETLTVEVAGKACKIQHDWCWRVTVTNGRGFSLAGGGAVPKDVKVIALVDLPLGRTTIRSGTILLRKENGWEVVNASAQLAATLASVQEEGKAAAALRQAKPFLAAGRHELGRKYLEKIVAQYEGTEAAEEAKRLLRTLH